MERDSKKETMVTLAVLLVVVLIVTGAVVMAKNRSNETASTTNTTTSTGSSSDNDTGSLSTASATTPAGSSEYKNGTYSATGNYATPDGTESITVKVTLKDGNVSDTSADASMRSRESKEYVAQFLEAYKSYVVGKDVDALKLSRVSGSSLTSQGFNSAIEQIRTQAES
jgi:uncharacterized protein with FMN-binding domain